MRLGEEFYLVFLYGDVPDASEFLKTARALWLEIKAHDVPWPDEPSSTPVWPGRSRFQIRICIFRRRAASAASRGRDGSSVANMKDAITKL